MVFTPIGRAPGDATARVGHRNRLRYLEIVDGVVYVELIAELTVARRFATAGALLFVRDPSGIRLEQPECIPDGMTRSPAGESTASYDVASRLTATAIVLVLRDRLTGVTVRVPTETSMDATPEVGPRRRRTFAVQFSATVAFDLARVVAPSRTGSWGVSTELRTLGTTTIAPVGPFRDRTQVDDIAGESTIADRRLIRSSLTGLGPQVVLEMREPD
ncbi:MAG TPA: hypothetical protein VGJ28_06750 [Micromonosporaceae bacterium]|jgi:hypothetical protein